MKKILITGNTGFKGSWLTIALSMAGHVVDGLSLDACLETSFFARCNIRSLLRKQYFLDISDPGDWEAIDFANYDIIYHFAAQPLVSEGYKNPLYTYQVNFNGTLNLINTLIQNRFQGELIIATTDKVYLNKELKRKFVENDELGGNCPYSNSKALVESSVPIWRALSNDLFTIKTVRVGNVYGGGDFSKNRILPDIYRSIKSKRDLHIRNPNSIRPWLFIADAINGYLKIQGACGPKEWNIAPDNSDVTVLDIVKLSAKHSSLRFKINTNYESFNETNILKLDNSLIKKSTSWRQHYTIEKGLDTTLKTYQIIDNKPSKILDYAGEILCT